MIYSNIEDIAKYYLCKDAMSNKKLNKILYYAYCWTLTLLNDIENGIENKLFQDKFEGWVHGPVCPKIYSAYKEYGWSHIPKIDSYSLELAKAAIVILDDVWNVYGEFTGDELENMTHQEKPWKESRFGLSPFDISNRNLDDSDILQYYTEQMLIPDGNSK